jgi:hypothetical protein
MIQASILGNMTTDDGADKSLLCIFEHSCYFPSDRISNVGGILGCFTSENNNQEIVTYYNYLNIGALDTYF